jgi:hypothetical protein
MALFQVGRRRMIAILSFGVAVILGLSEVTAGPLATTNFAYNNGAGPDAGRWRGTAPINGLALGDNVVAEVDWAVFSLGNFQSYLDGQGIAQVDPSNFDELIYVYQIASVTAASPGIDTLTVGIDAPDDRGSVSAPSFVPTGAANAQSPSSGGDNTTSMAWFFNGTELEAGDTSDLLVFSSHNVPEFDFLNVSSGLAGPPVPPLVASPSNLLFQVPEPTTAALGLLAGLAVLGLRKRKFGIA